MDDKHADHPHTHLRHFIVMRVEHLRAILAQCEFIFHSFAGFYVRLGEPERFVAGEKRRRKLAIKNLNRRMGSKVSGDFVTQSAELCANLAGTG